MKLVGGGSVINGATLSSFDDGSSDKRFFSSSLSIKCTMLKHLNMLFEKTYRFEQMSLY